MFTDKTVVLGVTGSIAAYKIASLASMLKKAGADIHVVMTKNAINFINPITFESLTGNKCLTDTFDRNFQFHVEHVSLAKKADVLMVAPASANMIGKLAGGIADDMLSTTALACRCERIVVPAMNTNMYENPIVQDNLSKLSGYGWHVVDPSLGYLACGDTGKGKMPEPEELFAHLSMAVHSKDLRGKRVLITAGPTREPIDAVRFISNRSTGKMGYAIARQAALRGAQVTLVTGPSALPVFPFVEVVQTETAGEMYEAVMQREKESDIIIMAAAVADYRLPKPHGGKLKKTSDALNLTLSRTEDILEEVGRRKYREGTDSPYICGFAMESEELLARAEEKRVRKKADMIVANSIADAGAGFAGDTNICTILTDKGKKELGLLTKEETADRILDAIAEQISR